MTFPFGERVTLHDRSVTGQDSDGNDVYGDSLRVLRGVPVWPRSSTELVQGQDTNIIGLTCLLPPCTDVTHVDAVTVYGDLYEVDGQPGRYRSPFTATNPGVELNLKRVTG